MESKHETNKFKMNKKKKKKKKQGVEVFPPGEVHNPLGILLLHICLRECHDGVLLLLGVKVRREQVNLHGLKERDGKRET